MRIKRKRKKKREEEGSISNVCFIRVVMRKKLEKLTLTVVSFFFF